SRAHRRTCSRCSTDFPGSSSVFLALPCPEPTTTRTAWQGTTPPTATKSSWTPPQPSFTHGPLRSFACVFPAIARRPRCRSATGVRDSRDGNAEHPIARVTDCTLNSTHLLAPTNERRHYSSSMTSTIQRTRISLALFLALAACPCLLA